MLHCFFFVLVILSTRSSICRLQEVACPFAVFSGLDVPFLKLNLKCITVAMFFMEVRDLHENLYSMSLGCSCSLPDS